MVLDECPSLTDNRDILINAINTSTHWAKRCKIEFGNNKKKDYLELYKGGFIMI